MWAGFGWAGRGSESKGKGKSRSKGVATGIGSAIHSRNGRMEDSMTNLDYGARTALQYHKHHSFVLSPILRPLLNQSDKVIEAAAASSAVSITATLEERRGIIRWWARAR